MGFEGTAVTPQIKKLIQEDHLGSILLSAKNLKSKTANHWLTLKCRADAV